MNKFRDILIAVILLVGVAYSTLAEDINITFDEAEIALNDMITIQYQDLGVVWSDAYENSVIEGQLYNPPFDSEGRVLSYKANKGIIQLDFLADILSFQFLRPSNSASIDLILYDSTTNNGSPVLVHDFEEIGTDSDGDDQWATFTYNSEEYGQFDRIYIDSDDTFVMDNLVIGITPIIEEPADTDETDPAANDEEDDGGNPSDLCCFISSLW